MTNEERMTKLYEDLVIRGVSIVRVDPYPVKRKKLNITGIRDLPRLDPNIYGSRERVINHIMKEYNKIFNPKKGEESP